MKPLSSLTVVGIVNDSVVPVENVQRYAAVLEQQVTDFDFVFVANAIAADLALQFKTLILNVPDTTAVFLGDRVHDDVARLVGIEHAMGDYVLFCDMMWDDAGALPALLSEVRAGHDLVVARSSSRIATKRSAIRLLCLGAYLRIYATMTGIQLESEPTGLRVLSREAALFMASRPNAELLLRARSIGAGFASTSVLTGPGAMRPTNRAELAHSWSRSVGILLSVTTLPMRCASYTALLGGGLSILYSLYVFTVYLLKPDVAAGWTTISLQIGAMMFIFSLVLFFISEYVIQIHSVSPPRSRRYLVLREMRSPLSRRSLRLNVVDGEGQFQIGQPRWLSSSLGGGSRP